MSSFNLPRSLEERYCYGSRTFNIHYTGHSLVVTKPDGTIVEEVECYGEEIVGDVFHDLKSRFIFDYDNELK